MAEKIDLHTVEPAEATQNVAYNLDKKVGDKYVNEMPEAMVSENDRKTGVVSSTANTNLRDFGYKPNK